MGPPSDGGPLLPWPHDSEQELAEEALGVAVGGNSAVPAPIAPAASSAAASADSAMLAVPEVLNQLLSQMSVLMHTLSLFDQRLTRQERHMSEMQQYLIDKAASSEGADPAS